jgi:quercetin dioxygenase-like cupin family protein
MEENKPNIAQEEALLKTIFKQKPRNGLKNQILDILDNLALEENFDLNNPPLINQYSEMSAWQKATAEILPPAEFDNIHLHPLREDEKVHQFVAWAKINVPDELHNDMQESFLILEGSCRCQIGEQFFEYQAGDFFTIPLDTFHNLEVTSPQAVKVILQRVFV